MPTYDNSVDALVIRELPSGDHDKLLTLLTAQKGRIAVIAKGARSLKSRVMPACRAFVWGNFELHRKGDMYWLRDASVIQPFGKVGRDLEKLYLAQYLSDLCYELSGEDMPAEELLRLMLNTLHALDRGFRDDRIIKAVFELRAAALSGYMPEVDECGRCGRDHAPAWYLDVMNGCIVCSECVGASPAHASPKISVSRSDLNFDSNSDSNFNPNSTPNPDPDSDFKFEHSLGLSDKRSFSPDDIVTDAYGTRSILLPLPPAVLASMRYVLSSPQAKMLSFELKDRADVDALSVICETYILNHLERGFSSLKQYHNITKL